MQATSSGQFTHRQIVTILTGLMLGMFLAALDQTVVSTAIRTIADDLDGYALQAWATTAFLITSTIATPLYGKLSDMYGQRPFLLLAITLFVAGSALCGLAQSMYQLAAFRAFQGLGAGGLFTLALATIGDIVPPRERSKYQGYFLAVFATSSVLGPVIGGVFAGADSVLGITGWRWIFYINVPIGALALVVVFRVLRLPHTRSDHRIDWPGAIALIVGLVPLLLVAEQGRDWGWGSTDALACYVVGALGLAAFVAIEERYEEEALIPLRLFSLRTFAIGSLSSLLVGLAMFGALALIPQYLQIVKGSSPTVAGLQTLPLVLGIMSGAILSGQIISRTGRYKIFPVVGCALMAVAMFLFSLVGADTALGLLMLVMVVFGLGLGFNMQPVVLAVQNAVSARQIGVATSSVTSFRQLGGTVGTAVFLSILFSTLTGNITGALREAQNKPAFQQALAQHPDQAQLLRGDAAGGTLNDTSFISTLADPIAEPFRVGFSESMDLIFLLGALVMVVAFFVVLLLPEVPLREGSPMQEAADDRARDGADVSGIPSEVAPGA